MISRGYQFIIEHDQLTIFSQCPKQNLALSMVRLSKITRSRFTKYVSVISFITMLHPVMHNATVISFIFFLQSLIISMKI